MIGRVKDLLGLKGDAAPARHGDRLIPTHETFAPKTPDQKTDTNDTDARGLPDETANDARIEASLAAAVDKTEFSPSVPRASAPVSEGSRSQPDQGSQTMAASPRETESGTAARPGYPAEPYATVDDNGPWLADAFDRLFAEEQGESPASPFGGPFGLSDADLDRVAARVFDRLSRGPMTENVRRIVVEISERLIREEIARIREAAAAPPASSDQS